MNNTSTKHYLREKDNPPVIITTTTLGTWSSSSPKGPKGGSTTK